MSHELKQIIGQHEENLILIRIAQTVVEGTPTESQAKYRFSGAFVRVSQYSEKWPNDISTLQGMLNVYIREDTLAQPLDANEVATGSPVNFINGTGAIGVLNNDQIKTSLGDIHYVHDQNNYVLTEGFYKIQVAKAPTVGG